MISELKIKCMTCMEITKITRTNFDANIIAYFWQHTEQTWSVTVQASKPAWIWTHCTD